MSSYGYTINSAAQLSSNTNNDTIKSAQLGLSSSDISSVQTAMTTWQTAYANYLVSSGASARRKRQTSYNSITCSQLTSGPPYAFSASQLSGLSPTVFSGCVSILSASTNT